MFNKKYILDNLNLLNLFLSSFGIYLSYFFFGNSNYFYNTHLKSEIFVSAFLVSILILLVGSIVMQVINLISKKTVIIFNFFIFSVVLFISFHFLIRFADINYYFVYKSFFRENYFYIQILFYLLPFFLGLLIMFFLKKNIIKFNQFLFFLLVVFICLSSLRILNINYDIPKTKGSIDNDYKYYEKSEITDNKKSKKIYFMIFDEFDFNYLKDNIDNFPAIKDLMKKSFVHENFYTPGMFTLHSIPGILMGTSIESLFFNSGKIVVSNLNKKKIYLNEKNTLFQEFKKRNMTYSIFGYYLPYCKIFNTSQCYDMYNFKYEKINFRLALSFYFETLYIDKFIDVKDKKNLEKDNSALSMLMHENSLNFLKSQDDLIYIHYPFPHLKGRYSPDFYDENKIRLNKKHINSKVYIENMFLVEKTIKQTLSYLEDQKDSLLIITSDHWFKDRNKYTENKAYPVVFISKIIGDDNYFSRRLANNASSLKGLITEFLDGKIKSNYQISKYFNCCKNHSIYIKWGE